MVQFKLKTIISTQFTQYVVQQYTDKKQLCWSLKFFISLKNKNQISCGPLHE